MLKKMIANVIMDQVTKGLESKGKSVITDFLKNVNKEDIASKVGDMFTKNPEGTKKPDVSDIVSVFENFFKEKPKTEPVPDNEESLSDDAKSFIDTFTSEINSFWKTFREIDNADTAIDTLESKIEEIDTLLYSYMSKGSIDGFDKIKMSMYSAVLEQLCSMLNIENDMKEDHSNDDDNVTENTCDTEVEEDTYENFVSKHEPIVEEFLAMYEDILSELLEIIHSEDKLALNDEFYEQLEEMIDGLEYLKNLKEEILEKYTPEMFKHSELDEYKLKWVEDNSQYFFKCILNYLKFTTDFLSRQGKEEKEKTPIDWKDLLDTMEKSGIFGEFHEEKLDMEQCESPSNPKTEFVHNEQCGVKFEPSFPYEAMNEKFEQPVLKEDEDLNKITEAFKNMPQESLDQTAYKPGFDAPNASDETFTVLTKHFLEREKVYNDLHKFEKTFKELNPITEAVSSLDKEELRHDEESIVEPVETGLDRLLGTIEKANRIQKALQESNINNIANGVSKTIENNTFGNRINVNASNISVEEYFNTDPTIRIVDLNNEDHILDLLENSKLNTGNIKELYMLNKSKMLFDFNTNTILMTDLADFG